MIDQYGKTITIKRRVLSAADGQAFRARFGHGTKTLKLECGHEKYQKNSQKTPRRAGCHDCTSLSTGGHSLIGNSIESWDEATQMPVLREFASYEEARQQFDSDR